MGGRVPPLVLLGAFKEETDGLRKRMKVERMVARQGWRLFQGRYAGRELLLVQTGPGRRQVEAAMESLLASRPFVSGIVSLGFAGALSEELEAGELVLCSLLRDGDGDGAEGSCRSDPWLMNLAENAAAEGAVRVGTGVTVSRVVGRREERAALWKTLGAEVVDMESFWAGRLAQRWGIPFLAVRAVSDTVTHELPPFDQFLGPDGRWQLGKGAKYFLSHPADLAKMPGVYVNSRRAAARLTGLLEAVILQL